MPDELSTKHAMNRAVEQARVELERSRAQVVVAAQALRDDLSGMTRWRGWVARHPYAALAGALAVGIWLGRKSGRQGGSSSTKRSGT
jgi:ElaB/YqjD/DUF883 family membrane-anchored ribosome-binding protein